jgi:hypothetical protein
MVPITLLRKPETFAEISTKNLGHMGKKGGHILKIIFYTDKLPLIHTEVL